MPCHLTNKLHCSGKINVVHRGKISCIHSGKINCIYKEPRIRFLLCMQATKNLYYRICYCQIDEFCKQNCAFRTKCEINQ